ncbi:hypothetical protein R3P38DRAFT_3372035 [Favolaschia claudopus]|uniref:3'-5' exonuclease domain-containing protein n=1 Tax=Favolaschia claudopus TaxID=2862362 RepID=A0AAV9ZVQ5_9AGAR
MSKFTKNSVQGTISDSDLAALLADLNLASPLESENVIDETLLADSAPSDSEEAVEPESQPEAEKGSICEGFLQTLVTQLRHEINRFGRPTAYEHGSFWQRSRDPIFALDAARKSDGGMNPRELYMLDTFLWLPGLKTRLPGEPDILVCPRVNCTGRLTRKAPVPLPGVYGGSIETISCLQTVLNATFRRVGSRIREQIPESFTDFKPQAFITARAAIDKNLLSLMRGVFNSRCGPKPFADVLSEMHHLDHGQRELIYLAALRSSPTAVPTSPEQFSAYNDKLRFCGSTPSPNYCKAVFVDWLQAHRPYYDRIVKSFIYALIKLLALLNGVQTHVALYTVVNEYEEIRGQYLVLTKELSYVEECYKKIARSLELHGHEPTQLMWSDNARAERSFHERCLPSLKNGVVHIGQNAYSHLPLLTLDSEQFTFLSQPDLIDAACFQILRRVEYSKVMVTLAIQYNMQPDGQGGLVAAHGHPGVDLIGLATAEDMYLFKISDLKSVAHAPPNLIALLSSDRVVKLGYQVDAQFRRLEDLWNLQAAANTSSIDIGRLAKTKGVVSDSKASFSTLVGCVLGRSIAENNTIQLSHWGSSNLTPSQLSFVAVKLHAAHCIGNSLMRDPSVGLPIYSIIPGTLVDIRGGATKIVARGQILEQPATGSLIPVQHGMGDFEKKVKLTAHRVLVQVDEVLIPGYEPALHKLALGNFGPAPFNIIMMRSMVVTRKRVPPVRVPTSQEGFSMPESLEGYDPLENVLGPNDIPDNLRPNDYAGIDGTVGSSQVKDDFDDDDDAEVTDADAGSDAIGQRAVVDDSSLNSASIISHVPATTTTDSDDEYSHMDGVELAHLMEIHEQQQSTLAVTTTSTSTNSESATNLLTQPRNHSPATLPTRTLEDIWHVKDRLLKLLPSGHSAFRPFAIALGLATFVYDRDDRMRVDEVLRKKGQTWNEAIRKETSKMHRRVKRYIPPPDILVPALTALFSCWQDIECSINPRKNEHAVVPMETMEEFAVYNTLMKSGTFYLSGSANNSTQASKMAQTVDFSKLGRHWTTLVHMRANESREPHQKMYYKLTQQLERHHNSWVKVRAENATMEISRKSRQDITKILEDPERFAVVLDAVEPAGLIARRSKGKEKAHGKGPVSFSTLFSNPAPVVPSTSVEITSNMQAGTIIPYYSLQSAPPHSQPLSQLVTVDFTVNAGSSSGNGLGHSFVTLPIATNLNLNTVAMHPSRPTMVPLAAVRKEKTKKKCAACRDHKCVRAAECAGSGGRDLCFCVTTGRHAGALKRRRTARRHFNQFIWDNFGHTI